jgi:putative redox protein
MAMYHVDITNQGDYSFNVKSKESEFVVDIKGKGITPPDTLLASLGTCIGVYLRKYAEGVKLEIPEFSIKVDAEFSLEPPVCFRKINVKIDLKGITFDERRLKSLHEFIKNCPVHRTLESNPEVEIKIE